MRLHTVDELEERRIARRLARLADAVEPLPDEELEALLCGVASGALGRSPARPVRASVSRRVPGVAVAAAAALAIAVGIGHSERSSGDAGGPGATLDQPLSFPEGSALELLLAGADAERPT